MMKTASLFLAGLFCLAALCGCGGRSGPAAGPFGSAVPDPPAMTTAPGIETPVSTDTADPGSSPTPAPTPQGILPEEQYAYFTRVGFAASADGAPALSRWASPLRIRVLGKPDAGDAKALHAFAGSIEGIRGMPDIAFVTEGGNLVIGFLPLSRSDEVDGTFNGDDAAQVSVRLDGCVRVSARIFVADELAGRAARDAAIASLFLRSLGLAQDPQGGFADSALNPGSQAGPSGLDLTMLALLYSPELAPGMREGEAMPVVRALDPQTASGLSANNPNIGTEEALAYFNEVGFWWAEGAGDGIASKWASPVKLQVMGDPSEEQRALLGEYIERLNRVEGFPGVVQCKSGGTLVISYQPSKELKKAYAAMTEAESCYIKLMQGRGKITKCTIGASTDFSGEAAARTQFLRLFIKAMGFAYTSETWPDSILNYDSSPKDWSLLDWKMVELLYRPDVKPGAKRAAVMKMLGEKLK